MDENQSKIALLTKEKENLAAELSEAKRNARSAENEKFINELLADNKLVPGQRENALAILNLASDCDNGDLAMLSAGESLVERIKGYMQHQQLLSLPTAGNLQTDRIAFLQKGNHKDTIWRDDGVGLSPAELDHKIKNYMRRYGVDYQNAFNAVTTIGD